MRHKWYKFDTAKGYRQLRPAIYRPVLVMLLHPDHKQQNPVVVGYRKNAAGDKSCPFFVTPGATIGQPHIVLAWCDCLPVNYEIGDIWVKPRRGTE